MRKNVIALALSAILAISVVGCSSNNENNKKLANNNSQIEVKDNEILQVSGQKIILGMK